MDLDIVLDDMTGQDFANHLLLYNQQNHLPEQKIGSAPMLCSHFFYLFPCLALPSSSSCWLLDWTDGAAGGGDATPSGVVKINPAKSKHLETAATSIHGNLVDFVNMRTEAYDGSSRIPTAMVLFHSPYLLDWFLSLCCK